MSIKFCARVADGAHAGFLLLNSITTSLNVRWLFVLMIGQKITLEYFDQNESFKDLLPRSGRIIREISLEDGDAGWSLLELDEPFNYQHKFANPYVFRELQITHLLIKSRWTGLDIGGSEATSVFVLLVPDISILERDNISSKDFIHVCWGMIQPSTSNNSLNRSAG